MTFSVGSSACHISMSQIRKYNHALVEWYISDDKELYHKFYSNKAAIEQEMGVQLEWNELPEKKASRIVIEHSVELENKDKWNEQFDWFIDTMIRMKKAFKKYL